MTPYLLVQEFFTEAQPAHVRTFREFAEKEVILPNGPRKGLPFSADFMAFSAEVLDEFQRGRYTDFYGSGPVQSGKTTIFYVLPALYHLFELEEDIILAAPVAEMARSAYQERLLPSIMASRYRRLVPTKGSGSRGGKSMESIQFKHGPSIRFIGAGGGDQQISSYTSRVVVATELDKMDVPGLGSREADPVTKLKARSKSFGSAARFYGECTMSIKSGRIYQEVVERGTDSRVFLPCVHCGEWIWPERKGLIGWQEKPNVIEARAGAYFECPACRKSWSEFDRQKSLRNPRVVAKGQTVNREGVVEGELPPTLTYGFRWNAMASPLLKMADLAADEWDAEQSGIQARQKGVVQYTWAEAWEDEILDLSRPEVATILDKIVGHPQGTIPPGTVKLTLGVDVGKRVIWWVLVAWTADAQGHVVDFSGIDVPRDASGDQSDSTLIAALRAFRDNVIRPGWGGRQPDRCLFDSGWHSNVVYPFILESGQPRYLACKGFGTSSRHGTWRNPNAADPTPSRMVGNEWFMTVQPQGIKLVNVHGDHWKSAVHDGFWAPQGSPGSLTLYHGERKDRELGIFARQIVAEQRESKVVGDKEAKVVWVVRSRTNHYLDALSYARCAAEIEGIRLVAVKVKPPRPVAGSVREGGALRWSRDRY